MNTSKTETLLEKLKEHDKLSMEEAQQLKESAEDSIQRRIKSVREKLKFKIFLWVLGVAFVIIYFGFFAD